MLASKTEQGADHSTHEEQHSKRWEDEERQAYLVIAGDAPLGVGCRGRGVACLWHNKGQCTCLVEFAIESGAPAVGTASAVLQPIEADLVIHDGSLAAAARRAVANRLKCHVTVNVLSLRRATHISVEEAI